MEGGSKLGLFLSFPLSNFLSPFFLSVPGKLNPFFGGRMGSFSLSFCSYIKLSPFFLSVPGKLNPFFGGRSFVSLSFPFFSISNFLSVPGKLNLGWKEGRSLVLGGKPQSVAGLTANFLDACSEPFFFHNLSVPILDNQI